jgi:starch-binding outer membrane protein, SusD/RagB family
MKKDIIFYRLLPICMAGIFMVSCTKKLDLVPTNGTNSGNLFTSVANYKQVLAKVYGSFATTGSNGAGSGDIQCIDAGTSDFLRLYWKAQELPTDEAVVQWGDVGIQDFHNMNWTPNNPFLTGLYYRSLYQITLANDFIRQSADEKLAARKITGASADSIKLFAIEARFLRAFQYAVMMDIFANPPFVDEAELPLGSYPKAKSRAELFSYIESELKAIEPALAAAKTNEYGRADKAAAWSLLARIYLNAKVYTGTEKNTEAITYSKKVIDAGYSLIPDYTQLMLADNQQNTSEFIFTINYDGNFTQNYGGTTFLTHAPLGGSIKAGDYGIDFTWSGLRTTKAFVNKFPSGNADKRAQFYTDGQNLEINSQSVYTDGYAIIKYKNKTRAGVNGSNLTFVDIDFPLFRLSEMYLIYAEAVLRKGTGGDEATALGYINTIRTRAYNGASGNWTAADLTLENVLDERARELYWEGFRRTDLIRYGRFTNNSYLWPWKGGVAGGVAVGDFRNLYPLPSSDVTANPSLNQNPGY